MKLNKPTKIPISTIYVKIYGVAAWKIWTFMCQFRVKREYGHRQHRMKKYPSSVFGTCNR
jgi:hypothetical protein